MGIKKKILLCVVCFCVVIPATLYMFAHACGWFLLDAGSPLNYSREGAFECVYEWGRLEKIPANAKNVDIDVQGSVFTAEFTLEFDADANEVKQWLSESAGIQDSPEMSFGQNGDIYYNIKPGSKAVRAEVWISNNGTHVKVYVCWS